MSEFKALFPYVLSLVFTLTGASAAAQSLPAQTDPTSATAAVSTRTLDEFMRTAADNSNLNAAEMKPWHLRGRYQRFGPDKKMNADGTFEEWWASPDKSKVMYTSGDRTFTEYRTASGTVYTGDETLETAALTQLLVHPLPYPAVLNTLTFTTRELEAGTTRLNCYIGSMRSAVTASGTAYCLAGTTAVIRAMEDAFGNRTTWNSIVKLNDRYVAKTIRQIDAKQQPTFNIDVDQVDASLGVDEAFLVPPAEAKPMPPRRVTLSSRVMQANRLDGENPRYPVEAKMAQVQGTVVIQATINRLGVVTQLRVISGPPMLQQPSVDAVRTWRYKPYLLNGNPVEVETTINVVFNLSR